MVGADVLQYPDPAFLQDVPGNVAVVSEAPRQGEEPLRAAGNLWCP